MLNEPTNEPLEDNTTVKLDSLGPIILNVDGSMSRIPNWSSMPKHEQDTAQRLISIRNKKRKEALLELKKHNNVSVNTTDPDSTDGDDDAGTGELRLLRDVDSNDR